MSKPVTRYEGGSLSFLSLDPEGEEFLARLDKAYQTQVESYINLVTTNEPSTYEEASVSLDKDKWWKAMEDELKSLMEMNTFKIVDRPKDRKVISCKWVYRIKRNSEGKIERYKARLVARSFSQIPGLDYLETYALVTRLETMLNGRKAPGSTDPAQ